MFSNQANSRQISSGAAQVKRAATAIRAVVKGEESFMRTIGDVERYRADLPEADIEALRAAAMILERLHDKRSGQAKQAATEEKAFEARQVAARKQAAEIFDSWRLDVAGWLPILIDNRGRHWIMQDIERGEIAGDWDRNCNYARDCFLNNTAYDVASGKGTVEDLMRARRERLAAHRDCEGLEDMAQRVTTALVAQRLARANTQAKN